MKKIRVGIVGGAGYTGGELIRLLIRHEEAEIGFVHSKSNAGQYLYAVHRDLTGDTRQKFTSDLSEDIDVLFLCVGHHEARKFLQENEVSDRVRIIDLSQDFRLRETASSGQRTFVYGLPEINREKIRTAVSIANPGCFATAIQLGLLPLAKTGLLGEVHTTGITGSTGAGQGLSETTHFSWRENNVQAYKTLTHQHLAEIEQSLAQTGSVERSAVPPVHFVPWRGDFTRGIFVSSTLRCETPLKTLEELYTDFYAGHPFTIINQEPIFLKQVVNTNKCMISMERAGSLLVVHSVIDNLLKGASGQAVQNMNLMFGIPETTGLMIKANYF